MKRLTWLTVTCLAAAAVGGASCACFCRLRPKHRRQKRPKLGRPTTPTTRRCWRPSGATGRGGAAPTATAFRYETGLLDTWPDERPAAGLASRKASAAATPASPLPAARSTPSATVRRQRPASLPQRRGRLGSAGRPQIGSGGDPNCTPTVDGDLVFGLTLGGDLSCCKTEDGSLVWTKNYERDFGVDGRPGWGFSESPLVDGDRLICTPGNNESLLAASTRRPAS